MGGCYQLLIRLSEGISLQVGRLGEFFFPAGYYIYTGRAKRALSSRIRRHLAKNKRKKWHIDYLTSSPEAEVVQLAVYSDLDECRHHREAALLPGARVIVSGFGSADCRRGCSAHLLYYPNPIDFYPLQVSPLRDKIR
jgi:Uri superfamily endonuclease